MSALVSAALLGTNRSTPNLTDLPLDVRSVAQKLEGDSAVALLDAAALDIAYRRGGAGATIVPAPMTAPAPDDVRLMLPQSSSAHLLSLLATKAEILDNWFGLVIERNFRAPDHIVAQLLSYSRANEHYRERILWLVGERGQWLAAQNPAWKMLLRHRGNDPDVWRHGTPAARSQWLIDTRRRDPALARIELENSWATERGERKAAFVAALAVGRSIDDALLLENALDDDRKDVRREAVTILRGLPGSHFGERMAQRVRDWVHVDRSAPQWRLVVKAPESVDAAARRDGIEDRPNPHTDYRAEYVRQAISSAPLSLWGNMIGYPTGVVNLGIDTAWEAIVHDAWTNAALAQENAEWAAALFRLRGLSTDHRLLRLVPSQLLVDLLRSGNGDANLRNRDRAAIYAALPRPWPDDIAAAVVAQWERVAAKSADSGAQVAEYSRLKYAASLRLAQTQFPYSAVPLLNQAAQRTRSVGWQQAFIQTSDVITRRKALLEELT